MTQLAILFKYSWRFIYIVSALAFITSKLSGADLGISLAVAGFLFGATELALTRFNTNPKFSFIFSTLAAYIAFAYTGKLAALIYLGEMSWLAVFSDLIDRLTEELVKTYAICSIGLLGFIIGVAINNRRSKVRFIIVSNIKELFIAIIVIIFFIRLLSITFLDIGVPGVKPVSIGVPLVTGILALLIGPVGFLLTNVNLYLNLYTNQRLRTIFLSLGLVAANTTIDLWVGYKQMIMMECLVLSAYYFSVKGMLSPPKRRVLLLVVIFTVIFSLLIYKYVNLYRFALLSGQSTASAIATSVSSGTESEGNTLIEIGNRINGIDNFYAAVNMSRGRNYSFLAITDDELVRGFVAQSLGDEDAVTTFGLTQFGAFYAVGGIGLLALGSLMLGYLFSVISSFTLKFVARSEALATAYAPILAIFFLKVLFAGGQMVLFAKELLFSMAVLYLLSRLLTKKI